MKASISNQLNPTLCPDFSPELNTLGFAVPQHIEKHIRKCQARLQHQTKSNAAALKFGILYLSPTHSFCVALTVYSFRIYLNISTQIRESDGARLCSVVPSDRTRGLGEKKTMGFFWFFHCMRDHTPEPAVQRGCRVSVLTGQSPEQPAATDPALSTGLEWAISRSPLQPQLSCHSAAPLKTV